MESGSLLQLFFAKACFRFSREARFGARLLARRHNSR
jgi:hypothetical protein